MTYFANGDAGLAKASRKYTGAYQFEVEPLVADGKITTLQLTEKSGPFEPDIGHFTNIPVSEVNGDIITFNATKVQEYAPPETKGGTPRKSGQNNFEGTYYPGFFSFQLTRVGSAFPGTYWTFESTPCVGMPEPPTNIAFLIGSACALAYGWIRRRKQQRQRPVGPPEAIE
jgi:hypothetical protein